MVLRCIDLSLQQDADSHFIDRVRLCCLIPFDLVQADIVLSIASCCESRHVVGRYLRWRMSILSLLEFLGKLLSGLASILCLS